MRLFVTTGTAQKKLQRSSFYTLFALDFESLLLSKARVRNIQSQDGIKFIIKYRTTCTQHKKLPLREEERVGKTYSLRLPSFRITPCVAKE